MGPRSRRRAARRGRHGPWEERSLGTCPEPKVPEESKVEGELVVRFNDFFGGGIDRHFIRAGDEYEILQLDRSDHCRRCSFENPRG